MAIPNNHVECKVDLEQVIDNLPSAIIVVDRDRRVLLANKSAALFVKRPKDAFFGLHGGEAFGCVNANIVSEGCGFAPACEFCTIRNAVMETFETHKGRFRMEATISQ